MLAIINRFQSAEAVVGQLVVHQREIADRVYFLVSGRIAVCHSMSSKTFKVIRRLGPGDHLGFMSFFADSQIYQELAKAVTFCDLQILLYTDLHELLCKHEDIATACQEELDHCKGEEVKNKSGSRTLTGPVPNAVTTRIKPNKVAANDMDNQRRIVTNSHKRATVTNKKELRKKLQDRMDKIALAAHSRDPGLDRVRPDAWLGEPASPGRTQMGGNVGTINRRRSKAVDDGIVAHRISNPLPAHNAVVEHGISKSRAPGSSAHRISNPMTPAETAAEMSQNDKWKLVGQAVVSAGSAFAAPNMQDVAMEALKVHRAERQQHQGSGRSDSTQNVRQIFGDDQLDEELA